MTEPKSDELKKKGAEFASKLISGTSEQHRKYDETRERVERGELDPLELVLAEKKVIEFLADFEISGALRKEKFSADESEELDVRGFEQDEVGELSAHVDDERKAVLMVSLTELDRINDEGGHDAGDKAIADMVTNIETAIQNAVRPYILKEGISDVELQKQINGCYGVYRIGGSDFIVRLKLPVAGMEGTRIIQNIKENISAVGVEGTDCAPVVKNEVRYDEAVDIFNEVSKYLTATERASYFDEDAKREFIQILLRVAEFKNEVSRLFSGAMRYFEKKAAAGSDESAIKAADVFFEKYIRRSFENTPLANPDAYVAEQGEGGAADFMEKAREAVIDVVVEKFARETSVAEAERRIITGIASRYGRKDLRGGAEIPMPVIFAPEFADVAQMKSEDLQAITANTSGKKFMREFGETLARAEGFEKRGDIDTDLEIEINKLLSLSEMLPRFKVGETEYDTRHMIEGAVSSVKEGRATESDRNKLRLLYEIAKRQFEIVKKSRDSGTGLLNRGEFFKNIKTELSNINVKGESGEDMRVFFIDMAFLKYFNQHGGHEVGNLAIKNAAEILEKAVNASGSDAEVYRYAGDEFVITLKGGKEDERKIIKAIEELRIKYGPLPTTEKSSPFYKPELLHFDYGVADAKHAKEVLQSLAEAGIVDAERLKNNPKYYLEQLVETQIKLADAAVGRVKSSSRLRFLLEKQKLLDVSLEGGALRQQFNLLIQYSKKALFGKGKEFLDWVSGELKENGEDRLFEIIENELAGEFEKRIDAMRIRNLVIESHVREKGLREEIQKREEIISSLNQQLKDERKVESRLKTEISDLELRLTQITAKRAEIIAMKEVS